MSTETQWDPDQYLRFEEERGRPFADLLGRVAHPGPRHVVDLGCGPGNMTAQLIKRWPNAHVLGIDNSREMIDRAQLLAVPGQLEYRLQDLRDWKPGGPDGPVDVIVSNATLQWVPNHADLFPDLIAALASGGVFAFQVPGNFNQPSHTLIEELAASDRWRDQLGGAAASGPRSLEPDQYLEAILATGTRADVWETTYLHVLDGPHAVLEWIRGTGLRPVLAALEASGSQADTDEFLATYSALLGAAYPKDRQGRTIFPFRRIFAAAALV